MEPRPSQYKAPGGTQCGHEQTITTEKACREAGPAVGHPFAKRVRAASNERPAGCFWDQNGKSYFNENLQKGSLGWAGVGGLCIGVPDYPPIAGLAGEFRISTGGGANIQTMPASAAGGNELRVLAGDDRAKTVFTVSYEPGRGYAIEKGSNRFSPRDASDQRPVGSEWNKMQTRVRAFPRAEADIDWRIERWAFHPYEGGYRIQNRWSGLFLSDNQGHETRGGLLSQDIWVNATTWKLRRFVPDDTPAEKPKILVVEGIDGEFLDPGELGRVPWSTVRARGGRNFASKGETGFEIATEKQYRDVLEVHPEIFGEGCYWHDQFFDRTYQGIYGYPKYLELNENDQRGKYWLDASCCQNVQSKAQFDGFACSVLTWRAATHP